MARIQRQELKHDEFVDTLDATLLWVEDRWRNLLALALIAVAGGGSVGGLYWWSQQQEERASAALLEALMTYQAPVQAGLPPLPGEGAQKSFASEREKFEAALKEFTQVHSDYPRTQSGLVAGHFQALCQDQLGDTQAAVTTLERVVQTRNANAAAAAKLTLAGFYQKLGKPKDAEKLLRELADKPAETVPKGLALLELATLKAQDDPNEARRLLNQVKTEYADTEIAAEATRRMELLPAPPPAAPAPVPAQP